MSELITRKDCGCRGNLLTTVSAVVLLASAASDALAQDAHPTIWIEVGAQLEQVDGALAPFAPDFLTSEPRPLAEKTSPLAFQHPPHYSNGFEGKIVFEPEGSEWQLAASIRYGRSNRSARLHQEATITSTKLGFFADYYHRIGDYYQTMGYADTRVSNSESHTVLDFTAGKDLGIGALGKSALHFGIRFAQFNTKSGVALHEVPDGFASRYFPFVQRSFPVRVYHINELDGSLQRSFSGIGPSLKFESTGVLSGSRDDSAFTFDWGANAAILFGRQKAAGRENVSVEYHDKYAEPGAYYPHGLPAEVTSQTHLIDRSRSVVVPNVGGFAGFSLKFPNAKISLGYRADFFFGAMDGGTTARKTYDRSFHGPFATVSVGLGG